MAQLDAADSMPGLFLYKTIAIVFLLNFFIEIEIHKNVLKLKSIKMHDSNIFFYRNT